MDEHRIVELLTRKIAGEASQEELGELSYLLTKYPDSVYYEALLEQVWDLGKSEAHGDLSEVFKKHKLKFKDELKFKNSGWGLRGFIRKPVFFFIAFACMFFSAAAFIIERYKQPVRNQRIDIMAGKGIRKETQLPDGTVVWLNSNSKISYDRDMLKNDLREVELTGEAFFSVVHHGDKAFIATTGKVAVKMPGGEFNIKEYPDEGESEATVLKGSAELTVSDRADQIFLLRPSEKFVLLERGRESSTMENNPVLMIEHISPIKLGSKEYIRETAWVENTLVFRNESFEDLLPKLERWYNVKILFQNPEQGALRFTGVVSSENIVQALDSMKLIKPFNYKLTANEVKIY